MAPNTIPPERLRRIMKHITVRRIEFISEALLFYKEHAKLTTSNVDMIHKIMRDLQRP